MLNMLKNPLMVKRLKTLFIVMLLGSLNFAFAAGDTPWLDGLQKAIDIMTGKTATLFATLAVIILGYMAMIGKLEMGLAGKIIGGIVLVFGAPHVVSWFS